MELWEAFLRQAEEVLNDLRKHDLSGASTYVLAHSVAESSAKAVYYKLTGYKREVMRTHDLPYILREIEKHGVNIPVEIENIAGTFTENKYFAAKYPEPATKTYSCYAFQVPSLATEREIDLREVKKAAYKIHQWAKKELTK